MKWLIIFSILLLGPALWSQNGPYAIFEIPQKEPWTSFANPQAIGNVPAAFVWQPDSPTPLQGVILSTQGLALLPSNLLDSSLARQGAWLHDDPNGEQLSLSGTNRLAVLTAIEDVTEQVLEGISDTLSPAARSVKVANRFMGMQHKPTGDADGSNIRPFYLGNRYHRYEWRYVEARLLGQAFGPDGDAFALVRLAPPAGAGSYSFSSLPIHGPSEEDEKPAFLCGLQIYPAETLPPAALNFYYTQLWPLLQEVQLILTGNWERRSNRPEWMDQIEEAIESEMPLQPFADPGLSVSSAEQQAAILLDTLKENRTEWRRYQQIQQRLETGYEEIAPYLIARELTLEIIPTRLQIFRLLRLLMQWEKTMAGSPDMLRSRAGNLDRFLDHFYKNFDVAVDQQIAQEFLDLYLKQTRHDLQSPFVIEQWAQAEKDSKIMAAALYQKSRLTDEGKMREALRDDAVAFFQDLKNDYAYLFVETWEQEHRELISKPLAQREVLLREEQRKMMSGLLRYVPQQACVEKGGLSLLQLPATEDETLRPVSPHFLGNYAEGSAVLSADGQLLGITYAGGSESLSYGRPGDRVMGIEFLEALKTQFPQHAITKEIFGLP